MPAYDFRCEDCKWKGILTFKTYAAYDADEKQCPRCKSKNLTRVIKRVALAKSEATRFDTSLGDDDSMLDDLADSDPATIGRYMRRMSHEAGEDLGDEFNEVVDRLERGEDPEAIEQSMAVSDDLGSGDDAFDGGLAADD
jgi:putative FmdB family regulatory protein